VVRHCYSDSLISSGLLRNILEAEILKSILSSTLYAHQSPTMEKKPEDLTPKEFPKIAWQSGKLAEPLGQLFDCVVEEVPSERSHPP
jgi:hypothetical protein